MNKGEAVGNWEAVGNLWFGNRLGIGLDLSIFNISHLKPKLPPHSSPITNTNTPHLPSPSLTPYSSQICRQRAR